MSDPEYGTQRNSRPDSGADSGADPATIIEALRQKSIAARARVAQIDALHLDPETLEEQLFLVGPTEAAQIRQSERQISLQVAAATEKAEEAEAEFEIAMLEHGYGLN